MTAGTGGARALGESKYRASKYRASKYRASKYLIALLALAPACAKGEFPKTEAAHEVFWSALHGGRYEAIEETLAALTEAEAEHPGHASTAAFIGFLHTWRVSESARVGLRPTFLEDIAAARRGFARSLALDPSDARVQGFLAAMTAIEGSLTGDDELVRLGQASMDAAVEAWPEFNLFTAGYVNSLAETGSPEFARALEQQWENIEVCLEKPVDRQDPDLRAEIEAASTASEARSARQGAEAVGPASPGRAPPTGTKSACWNNEIAPHNFEGFFLNMGDMLVKSGDWRVGRTIYAYARLSPTYDRWPFAPVLEERIRDAETNIASFQAVRAGEKTRTMMFASSFSCMACHQVEP